jgi:nitrogen fixation/metabolism regulation signal transduction histidine kinase
LRVQRGKFGSRMLLKLAAIFALVGVIPGVLIYTVSYQFVSRSIESWFDVKVEGALDAGLNLGRGTLEAQRNDLANKTRLAAERLADRARRGPQRHPAAALERLREQLSAQDIAIVGREPARSSCRRAARHGRCCPTAVGRCCCARRAARAW